MKPLLSKLFYHSGVVIGQGLKLSAYVIAALLCVAAVPCVVVAGVCFLSAAVLAIPIFLLSK